MKKTHFAFIAVALIALLSAFTTSKHPTTTYKLHRVNATTFTVSGIVYVEVSDKTGQSEGTNYNCIESIPNPECTFESNEQPVTRSSKLSITKLSWDSRANVVNGLLQ